MRQIKTRDRGIRIGQVKAHLEIENAALNDDRVANDIWQRSVDRMIAAVMLGLAEIELEFRQQRQEAGIEVAKKKGVYKGRKKGTFKGKPKRAAELRANGLTLDEIAQALR